MTFSPAPLLAHPPWRLDFVCGFSTCGSSSMFFPCAVLPNHEMVGGRLHAMEVFRAADVDGDGYLTKTEFLNAMTIPSVQWAATASEAQRSLGPICSSIQ